MRRRRAQRRAAHGEADAGFTLIEAMVGLLVVTVGLLALLAELTTYIQTQGAERSQAQAVRFLSTTVEDARALTDAQLAGMLGTHTGPASPTSHDYTITTDLRLCTLGDSPAQCTPPTSAATTDRRLSAQVRWTYANRTRQLSTTTTIADSEDGTYRATGTGTLGGLLGGVDRESTVVTVQTMSASPSPVTVSATGVPTSAVTLTLQTLGLTGATTSVPATWTDDLGAHQVSLTGGPTTWTATVPAASIRKAPAAGQTSTTLTFTAAVPGAAGLTQTTVTLVSRPTIPTCTISPSPIKLALLTSATNAIETLTCTTGGLRTTDPVTVTYTAGLGTATAAMTSSDGTTWVKVLPKGTALGPLGLLTTFTFKASRDGVQADPFVISSVLGL